MKRLLLLIILLLLSVVPVMAQDESLQIAQPVSGRYQFELPDNWIVKNQSSLFEGDDAFPLSETVLAGTSEDVLELVEEDDFELFDTSFDGSYIVTTIIPEPFFRMDGMDPEEFATSLGEALSSDAEGEVVQETIELRGISGQNFIAPLEDGYQVQIALLFDPSNNLLMFIALSDEENASNIENALMSLTFYQFSEEELLDAESLAAAVEIAPDFAAIDVPAGWWLLQEDTDNLVILTPTISQEMFDEGPMEGLLASQSVAIISTAVERDDLPASVYRDDGTLDLERVVMEEIGEDSNGISILDWDGAPGLAGVKFEVEIPGENIQARGLLLDGDDMLYFVAGISTMGNWDTYSDLVDAILLTIRRIEE